MSDLLNDKTLSKARHVEPGTAGLLTVEAGQFLQIQTIEGKQVADFVAFSADDLAEHVSTSHTRVANMNIVPQLGMSLYTNRRQPLFEITEDTVGRHDMLVAACDPARYEALGAPGHASCRQALTDALAEYEVGIDRMPDPINWFMNVAIKQKGELDVRPPLAEAGDYVLLKALRDVVVAVSACPQDLNDTNGGKPTALRIAVYRDEPLPEGLVAPAGGAAAAAAAEVEPEPAAALEGGELQEALEPGPVAAEPVAIDAVAEDGAPEDDPVLVQEAVVAIAEAPETAIVAEAVAPAEADTPGRSSAPEAAEATS
ncbi:MAG: urea carboxylase-associated family protein [Thermomicrobiales bacterium]|nr:urea carboxylase-associated family protein [Thermomicrobiales bacterium]